MRTPITATAPLCQLCYKRVADVKDTTTNTLICAKCWLRKYPK